MNTGAPHRSTFWSRLVALTKKETRQLVRDPSSIAIGIGLPAVLILLFGYGISLDVNNAPVAVVMEDTSPAVVDVLSGLQLSPYITLSRASSMKEAERMMTAREVDAILRVPGDFSAQLAAGHGKLQLVVHGTDATTARIIQGYVGGAVAQWSLHRQDRGANAVENPSSIGVVVVLHRLWFNAANTSSWYLVPGLMVLIITVVAALLTSMVVAREWERGTLEALFVTSVRPLEILLAKLVPYFGVSMIGLAMCGLAAHFLFHMPAKGSLLILLFASLIYMMFALGFGLLISAAIKNQFIACQTALVTTLVPVLMLSGFLFDLNNVPLVVHVVGELLPATHYLELLKTLLLAGNVWPMIVKDCLILVAYALVVLFAARRATQKRIA